MPSTKTPRTPRKTQMVYPFSMFSSDPVKDKRNAPARVAYGDKGVRKMAKTLGLRK
jgi:hypothetical protein